MNDPASSPSRLLRFTTATARWLLGLLVAAWLLFALSVVVLHGWIVPRIGEIRGLLETQATRAIGVPVRIASVAARSDGLFPSIELGGVTLQDAQGREALRLARVVASVSPRSLWRLSLEQLYLERPQLDVRMDAQGRLHVAGLDVVTTDTSGEGRAADWFFAQREVVVEGGTVRWTDERRGAEPLLLTDVRFAARNGGLRHALRLDATPPEGWGERFTLRGRFRQPLLSVRSGHWQTWNGELYAELPRIDVRRLGRYVTLDARIREGRGALRAWVDVRAGRPVGGAADLALERIDASLGDGLSPLVLRAVTGRLAGRRADDGTLEVSTQRLQFEAADGLRWPGGNLSFSHTPARERRPERGAFKADRLDLGALALVAGRLPLGDATHRALAAYAPRGVVEAIDASWQGPLADPVRYQARGRASGLSLAAQAATRTPGLRGASVEFDATHLGGSASLDIAQGALDFPGIFEEPVIPLDTLSAQLQWKLDGERAQLQVTKLRLANADAAGEAQASWRTADPAVSLGRSRFPGVLDLQGQLTRADGTRVHRYLPLSLPRHTRDYVRETVTRGVATGVDFRVKGDLHDVPFSGVRAAEARTASAADIARARQGEFRIAARVKDVDYAYVMPSTVAAGKAAPWPGLTGVSGELIFERAGLQVRDARGRIAGAPGIEVTKADVRIADMAHHAPVLEIDARARGPLDELLKVGAPLLGGAATAVGRMHATGAADYALRIDLPLEAMDQARVRAGVTLGGNDLHLLPQAPALSQARGTLDFTETGFTLAGVQARLAGGEARIEGRGRYAGPAGAELAFTAQGQATAEGLRALREVPPLAAVARRASGAMRYDATLALRGGVPEFTFASSLQGLALDLPAPLAKAAGAALPLRIEQKVVLRETAGGIDRVHDTLSATLGGVASAQYVRDVSAERTRVLRGAIGIGAGALTGGGPALPDDGVLFDLALPAFSVPDWQALAGEAGPGGAARASPSATATASTVDDDGAELQDYLPTTLAVRTQALAVGSGRTLHDVVLGGSREGSLWRANVDATELNGYVEYNTAQAGRLHARLARLKIAPGETAQSVESLLDEQPGTLPALDVVIDDFELLGRHLGRAEIEAVNRGGARREWRLNRLAFTLPEASFTAQGAWAAADGAPAAGADRRRTAMTFRLEMADAGALLARFGMPGVIRRGHGSLAGEVDWRGSPLALDTASLGGQLHIDVASGQFLKADPGLAKLLGVLNLQALPRRLALDFRDVFSEGFAFDVVRGDAGIAQGRATTNNLQMKGVNAAVLMDGSADLVRETQDLRVVVVPEITAGTAALVATAINPVVGLGTFLAQWLLSRPLSAAATQEFQIEGTWADPKITRVPRRALSAGDAPKETTP
ncbi:MAG: TIGR02099 family protein [Variovorax sp.]|nr:MAG: TIGR02099 family protein [Variovorax sp.]